MPIQDTELLTAPFTEHEIFTALQSINKQAVSGPDGLTVTWYLVFKEQILPLLTVLYNQVLQGRKIKEEMWQGIGILL